MTYPYINPNNISQSQALLSNWPDCSCNATITNNYTYHQRCITCPTDVSFSNAGIKEITQKRIQNQVRAPASLYTMNLAALNVTGPSSNAPLTTTGFYNVNWNQSSDRNRASNSQLPNNQKPRYVPTRGNSLTSTLTAHRPGASAPGGIGVDIKHNSYDRYLARLKSKNLKTQANSATPDPKKYSGNKTKMYGMISGCVCSQ